MLFRCGFLETILMIWSLFQFILLTCETDYNDFVYNAYGVQNVSWGCLSSYLVKVFIFELKVITSFKLRKNRRNFHITAISLKTTSRCWERTEGKPSTLSWRISKKVHYTLVEGLSFKWTLRFDCVLANLLCGDKMIVKIIVYC